MEIIAGASKVILSRNHSVSKSCRATNLLETASRASDSSQILFHILGADEVVGLYFFGTHRTFGFNVQEPLKFVVQGREIASRTRTQIRFHDVTTL